MTSVTDEKFPHSGFPFRLEYQDGKEKRICWFQCQNHLDKHLTRYNLKDKDLKIDCQEGSLIVQHPTPKKRGRKPKQQLFSSIDQFFETNEKPVAVVGKVPRTKGKRK